MREKNIAVSGLDFFVMSVGVHALSPCPIRASPTGVVFAFFRHDSGPTSAFCLVRYFRLLKLYLNETVHHCCSRSSLAYYNNSCSCIIIIYLLFTYYYYYYNIFYILLYIFYFVCVVD